MVATKADWQLAVEAKQAEREIKISKWKIDVPSVEDLPNVVQYINKYLSKEEILITESTATKLLPQLAKGILTATQVCYAFCHRAAIAHQLVNCCTEIFFDLAMQRAHELDEYFKANGKPIGPMHGMPISLKDQFHIEGVDSTMGYTAWIGDRAERESVLVDCLRDSGAIFFCKTNLPQSVMAGETFNNVFGYTVNPLNRRLSCAGSSGGEGALIGARGSILGVGTDIGGSVRLPSWVQGLYGLRPSHGRLPYGRMMNSMPGQESVPSVVGPMSHSVDDLKLFVKSVLAQNPWFKDPKVVELEWREPEISGKLCFGITRWNGDIWPHPPVHRALDRVIAALRSAGHEVIEWDPLDLGRARDLLFQILGADGGEDIRTECAKSGEPLIPHLDMFINHCKEVDIHTAWKLNLEKTKYQEEYMEYWNATALKTSTGRPIDAWITPVSALCGIEPGEWSKYSFASIYTPTLNLLDYPVCIVPVTTVDSKVDKPDELYKPVSEQDERFWKYYNPNTFEGMPISVQVITRRLQEEKVLTYAGVLDESLKAL